MPRRGGGAVYVVSVPEQGRLPKRGPFQLHLFLPTWLRRPQLPTRHRYNYGHIESNELRLRLNWQMIATRTRVSTALPVETWPTPSSVYAKPVIQVFDATTKVTNCYLHCQLSFFFKYWNVFAEQCQEEVEESGAKGEFHWPVTDPGHTATLNCPHGSTDEAEMEVTDDEERRPSHQAFRSCTRFTDGTVGWMQSDLSVCRAEELKPVSPPSNNLTSDQVEKVADQVVNLVDGALTDLKVNRLTIASVFPPV